MISRSNIKAPETNILAYLTDLDLRADILIASGLYAPSTFGFILKPLNIAGYNASPAIDLFTQKFEYIFTCCVYDWIASAIVKNDRPAANEQTAQLTLILFKL
jgi:hypothetical protein